MKKLILISFIFSLVLTGCNSDNDEKISNIKEVTLNISYDTDGDSPLELFISIM